jgi:peroxiredoxin
MQCRYHAGQLGRLYPEFKARNCEIILILGENVDKAKKYSDSLHLPFPVLADPGRKIYHMYGLEKAAIFIQRTASIIIDIEGKIRYLKTTTNPMTWLQEYNELLSVIETTSKPG